MSRSALARSVAILLEEQRAESQAFVDLALSLRVCDVDTSGTSPKYLPDTDEELIEVGGRWDRRAKRWDQAPTDRIKVVRIPRGGEQEVAARWVAEWLRRYARGPRGPHWTEDGFRRVWTLLLEGGRRGGKSYLAVVFLIAVAVMAPKTVAWAISPTIEETDELEQAIRSLLPRAWYTFRGGGGGKALQFRFANGSRILCLSGHKPRSLKRGRCDIALYNEGQNMYAAGWRQLRGAAADKGGLVVITANPPDSEIGRWIEELHERARAGKVKAEVFKMTAASNPFVEVKSLEDMADEADDLTYRREVLGEFVPIGTTVMHAWSDAQSVIQSIPGHWIDVTAETLERHFGRPFEFLGGMDFQAEPHMVASLQKIYRDPAAPIDPTRPDHELIVVAVDEVLVEHADEYQLVDELEGVRAEGGRVVLAPPARPGAPWSVSRADEGYRPEQVGSVIDASGFFQDGPHRPSRTSEQWLRERGWRWLYYPDRGKKRNPEITERVKVANARLKSSSGRRRFFVLAHCEHTARAMRNWEIDKGVPKRSSKWAHACDAVTYPLYRLFARQRREEDGERPEYRSINRFDRRDRMV